MNGDTTDKPSYFEMEQIKETPFNVVSVERGKWFGVMGQERLTEIVESKEEAMKLVSELTWKNIINVIMILQNYGK